MKKKVCFEGVGTAAVTPFKDGGIDYVALSRIIDMQISEGADAVVIGGTTGEAATLSAGEREALYAFAAEKVGGRVKLILGTGSCDTARAVDYTKLAKRLGADGALCVTPYYNRGTERGVAEHFLAVADAADIPTIIYNVPTRTCVNISIRTLERLAEHENIVGIKESSDSLKRLSALSALSDRLAIYSGNDYANCSFYTAGGIGAVSVLSNLYPARCKRVYELCRSGRVGEALVLQRNMDPLIDALFAETNPSVIKYAMERCGLCSSEVRLPLTRPSSATRERLIASIERYERSEGFCPSE